MPSTMVRVLHGLINRASSMATASTVIGMCGLRGAHDPFELVALAHQAVRKSHELLNDIQRIHPSLQSLRIIDAMSNELCQVADAAELCRNTHTDVQWIAAAKQCRVILGNQMSLLNTSTVMHKTLYSIVHNNDLMNGFAPEQRRVAQLLLNDMMQAGIGLPHQHRIQARKILADAVSTEFEFSHNALHSVKKLRLPCRLEDLPDAVKNFAVDSTASFPMTPNITSELLRVLPHREHRENIFMTAHQCIPENIPVLERLRKLRHEHSSLIGFESFAHSRLHDSIAETPECALKFIQKLSKRLTSKARKEFAALNAFKQARSKFDGSEQIMPWDMEFYQDQFRRSLYGDKLSLCSSYFHIDRVLDGLNIIFRRVFGCCLKEISMPQEENWCQDTRKFEVTEDNSSGRLLGIIYMDLFIRVNKNCAAAHYTLRHNHDGTPSAVAVVCGFVRSSLLNHSNLVTLFHEIGHALHSILSHTDWQHMSGARGACDFVEIPAHLLERYAWEPRFLSLFARHYQTGQCIPKELLNSLLSSRRLFVAIDLQQQLTFAAFDQHIFGASFTNTSSTELFATAQAEHSIIPYVDGTHTHTRFVHACSYGACYYSYLMSQVLAAHIWRQYFDKDPLCIVAGSRFRDAVLSSGNSVEPRKLLQSYIGTSDAAVDIFVTHDIEV